MSFNRFIHRLFYPFVDWLFHLALNVSIVHLLFCLSVGLFSGSLFYPFIFLIFPPPILPFVGVNFVVHPSSIPTFAFPYISSSISGFIPSFDLSLVRSTSQSSMPCFIRSYIDTVVFFILRRMFLIDHFILHKLSSSGECLVQAGNIWA